MNIFKFLLFFLLPAIIIFSCDNDSSKSKKPNILWITSEDNGPYLGAYGDEYAKTPNLDKLASGGVVYENAFATTPVCAPSRFTLITGMYANSMGTEHMRSNYPVPDFVKFFPKYLKEAGYYTTNNAKKDYNTIDQPEVWDKSSDEAHYGDRAEGQPFFHVRNLTTTHESRLHDPIDTLIHDPADAPVPPYHPDTETVRRDWAHYYDQMTRMDEQVGQILDELEQSGEAENTIVFYFSDHGGALPGSKRFMFESGIRVPLIVYVPEKFSYLTKEVSGSRTDRLVSFVDFAPTVLSLVGIKPPKYMQGQAFLGEYRSEDPKKYVHSYRGRMGVRYDLVRSVRDKEFLYKRNYMPHRIYGQFSEYLWRAGSMQSWENEYLNGNLNETQLRFFETKPVEELYKISDDPHNINNLANNPAYQDVLKRMRSVNKQWLRNIKDVGFIPESTIREYSRNSTIYESVREQRIPIEEIIETAEMASTGNSEDLEKLIDRLDHRDPSVRYWAAMGFVIQSNKAESFKKRLLSHLNDQNLGVRITLAEALYKLDEKERAFNVIEEVLESKSPVVILHAMNVLLTFDPEKIPRKIWVRVQKFIDNELKGMYRYVKNASQRIVEKKSK